MESRKMYRWTNLQDRNRHTDVENGLTDTVRGKDMVGQIERVVLTYMHYCKIAS